MNADNTDKSEKSETNDISEPIASDNINAQPDTVSEPQSKPAESIDNVNAGAEKNTVGGGAVISDANEETDKTEATDTGDNTKSADGSECGTEPSFSDSSDSVNTPEVAPADTDTKSDAGKDSTAETPIDTAPTAEEPSDVQQKSPPEYETRYSNETPLKRIYTPIVNMKKRRPVERVFAIIQAVVGCMLGVSLGLMLIALGISSALPDLLHVAAIFVVSLILSSYIYDVGRIVSGQSLGLKPYYIRILFLHIDISDNGGKRVRLSLPTGKRCPISVPEGDLTDRLYLQFFTGGIISNAVWSTICFIAALTLTAVGISKVATPLWVLFAAGIVNLLINLLPTFGGFTPTDGAIVAALLTKSPDSVYLIKLYALSIEYYTGNPPVALDIPDVSISSVRCLVKEPEPYVEIKPYVAFIVKIAETVKAFFTKLFTPSLAHEAVKYSSEAVDAVEISEINNNGDAAADNSDDNAKLSDDGIWSFLPEHSESDSEQPVHNIKKKRPANEITRPFPRYTENHSRPSQYLLLLLFYRYYSELDSGAADLFTCLLAIQKYLELFPASIRTYLYRELCFIYSIGYNPPAAADYYFAQHDDDSLQSLRIRAYFELYANGRADTAIEICEKADKLIRQLDKRTFSPYSGLNAMEARLIKRLREVASQPSS